MSDEQSKIPGAYPQTPSNNEGQFSTLPHPAACFVTPKSNNPAGGAAESLSAIFSAAPGPVVPAEEMARNVEKPLGREELRAQAAALNKKE
ncbi:hypothetical protein APHAL10511_008003 [Amanita phalloides]|nr:hypothetical protein APHAL10511_008003 [Amanita phalloides]